MKSLEQVIKQKCKFLGNTTDPEEYRITNIIANAKSEKLLFMSNTTIETANKITLLEEIKPLFVYITSYVLYERLHITRGLLYIRIRFQGLYVNENDNINFWEDIYINPLKAIQDIIVPIKNHCFYMSYIKPLRVEILYKSLLRRNNRRNNNIRHNNIRHNIDSDHNDDSVNKIEPINNIKTFKNDLCTICLEGIPNVLFCLCGHICICKKCNEIKKLNSCPICKTENTIIRVIE